MTVERRHELGRGVVMYIPKSEEERMRACTKQTARQSQKLIAGRDHIESGAASTQRQQLDR